MKCNRWRLMPTAFQQRKVKAKDTPKAPLMTHCPMAPTELMAKPPQAACRRSMLRFLARRSPMMPALANMSSEMGSMPFWLITMKPLSGEPPQTCRRAGWAQLCVCVCVWLNGSYGPTRPCCAIKHYKVLNMKAILHYMN